LENEGVTWAALLMLAAQDEADPNVARPAAEMVPAEIDLFASIPDAPGLRRKLRRGPYRAAMEEVTRALEWPIDPSRILGLLGGELALAIPDLQSEGVLVIADTGIKNNSFASVMTRLMQDPWTRKEEAWKEGTVYVLSGPSTWYTHSLGRYFLLSTTEEGLRGLMERVRKPGERGALAGSEEFRRAVESAGTPDVRAYARWDRIRKNSFAKSGSLAGRLAASIPGSWAAAGLEVGETELTLLAAAPGRELSAMFSSGPLEPPEEAPPDALGVTVVHAVLDKWWGAALSGMKMAELRPEEVRRALGLDPEEELIRRCRGPLVFFDRREIEWEPILLFESADIEAHSRAVRTAMRGVAKHLGAPCRDQEELTILEPFAAGAVRQRIAFGLAPAVGRFVRGSEGSIRQTEGWKAASKGLPEKGCLMDYRTGAGLEEWMRLPARLGAARGAASEIGRTLEKLAPVAKRFEWARAAVEHAEDGLKGSWVLRLKRP
jgi:hypothetical protein